MSHEAGPGASFRLLGEGDIVQVVEIEKQSFLEPWDKERFAGMVPLDGPRCIVLEKDGEVIGYFVFNIDDRSTRLLNLAIHPAHRRRGFGKRCLELVHRLAAYGSMKTCPDAPEAAGVAGPIEGEVYLEVSERNLAAQCLYRKMGYRATRILRNHYPRLEEDAYVMTRKITAADLGAIRKPREGAVGP